MEKYDNWFYSEYSKAVYYLKVNQDITHISLGGKKNQNKPQEKRGVHSKEKACTSVVFITLLQMSMHHFKDCKC